jgi:hypothetical protein
MRRVGCLCRCRSDLSMQMMLLSREGMGRHDALTIHLVDGTANVHGQGERFDQAGSDLREDVGAQDKVVRDNPD